MPDEAEARVRQWTRAERDTVIQLREVKGYGPTKLSQLTGVPVPQIKFWLSSSKWVMKKAEGSSFRLRFQDWEAWAASSFRTRWRTWAKECGADLATVPTRPAIEEWLRVLTSLSPYCFYCMALLTPKNFAVDHKTPTARGGGFGFDNLAACCRRCNLAKGELTADEFRQLRALVLSWEDQGKALLARLSRGFVGRHFGGKT